MQNLDKIKDKISQLALDAGFQQIAVSDLDTSQYFAKFRQWVEDGFHGSMHYLERNKKLRESPNELHPGTCRVISLRYNYLPEEAHFTRPLKNSNLANISRYALGRDYHKLMRKKLQKLSKSVSDICENFEFRVFVDSAPVLETSFAEKSGLGWKGKHTLVINKDAGSWFFLAEIFVNLPLEIDPPTDNQCGSCNSCINLCPTGAIIAPYKVDARKCISYLTIENQNEIPIQYRKQIGNRIYGCDDCQLACPWNRYSSHNENSEFSPRHQLDNVELLALFEWSEEEFYNKLQGSPIRRIGYQNWLRNIAVALGNSQYSEKTIASLERKKEIASDMVVEHICWAINQQKENGGIQTTHSNNSSSCSLDKFASSENIDTNKTTKLIRTIEKMLPRDA